MSFTQDMGNRPPDEFTAALSQTTDVTLAFVRSVGAGLYVYQLDANATNDDCDALLTRLRQDARVRSVDIDQRRRVQQNAPQQGNAVSAPGLLPGHTHLGEVRDA